MKLKNEKIPRWAERALQGITHWIGHRRCVYRDYPLAEAALVAEVCNLIFANLADGMTLKCEVQYSSLLKGKESPTLLTQRARADLVVFEKPSDKAGEPIPRFIIEVKRALAPRKQILVDLRRLAAVRQEHEELRAFMFLISEAHRPIDYVNLNGTSIKGLQKISESDGRYLVRKTFKAAQAISKIDRAQYACLLEVFG